MPNITLYLDNADQERLVSWLNHEDEIAWIVPDGPRRWKAQPQIDVFERQEYALWHVPSGPLPLTWNAALDPLTTVENAWEGAVGK